MSFVKIGAEKECAGSELIREYYENVKECAQSCYGKSSVFIFGEHDNIHGRCKGDPLKCRCLCETAADSDGKCSTVDYFASSMYKYV